MTSIPRQGKARHATPRRNARERETNRESARMAARQRTRAQGWGTASKTRRHAVTPATSPPTHERHGTIRYDTMRPNKTDQISPFPFPFLRSHSTLEDKFPYCCETVLFSPLRIHHLAIESLRSARPPYPSVGNGCRATAPPERTLAAACVLASVLPPFSADLPAAAAEDDRPEAPDMPPLLLPSRSRSLSLSDLNDRSRCPPPTPAPCVFAEEEPTPPFAIRLDTWEDDDDSAAPLAPCGGGGGCAAADEDPRLPPSRAASRPPVRAAGSGRLEPAAGLRSSGR